MAYITSRNYCFTIFIGDLPYSEEQHIFCPDGLNHLKYAVWQLELCPETQRKHLQGYAEFDKVLSLVGAKKLFHENYQRTVHLEKRKGNQLQAIAYCQKEETRLEGPWTAGQPSVQGKRNDIHDVMDAIKDGASLDIIADRFPAQAAKYSPFFKEQIERHRSSLLVRPDITLRPWQEHLKEPLLGPPHPLVS